MAGQYDFTIERGDGFSRTLRLLKEDVAMNLTNYTARLRIRPSTTEAVSLELTVGDGITITPLTGEILFVLSAIETEALPFVSGTYKFHLIDPLGAAVLLVTGAVLVEEA